jgi:hypothetical protein
MACAHRHRAVTIRVPVAAPVDGSMSNVASFVGVPVLAPLLSPEMLAGVRTRSRRLLSLRRKRKADVGPHYEAAGNSVCLELFCRQFVDGDGGRDFPVT